jgi:hypothetical protein
MRGKLILVIMLLISIGSAETYTEAFEKFYKQDNTEPDFGLLDVNALVLNGDLVVTSVIDNPSPENIRYAIHDGCLVYLLLYNNTFTDYPNKCTIYVNSPDDKLVAVGYSYQRWIEDVNSKKIDYREYNQKIFDATNIFKY